MSVENISGHPVRIVSTVVACALKHLAALGLAVFAVFASEYGVNCCVHAYASSVCVCFRNQLGPGTRAESHLCPPPAQNHKGYMNDVGVKRILRPTLAITAASTNANTNESQSTPFMGLFCDSSSRKQVASDRADHECLSRVRHSRGEPDV